MDVDGDSELEVLLRRTLPEVLAVLSAAGALGLASFLVFHKLLLSLIGTQSELPQDFLFVLTFPASLLLVLAAESWLRYHRDVRAEFDEDARAVREIFRRSLQVHLFWRTGIVVLVAGLTFSPFFPVNRIVGALAPLGLGILWWSQIQYRTYRRSVERLSKSAAP